MAKLGAGTEVTGNRINALTLWNSYLYAGGSFQVSTVSATNFARWSGAAWSAGSATSPDGELTAVLEFSGATLVAGGFISKLGSVSVDGIAKWNGTTWSTFGSGIRIKSPAAVASTVKALVMNGSSLIAAGRFSHAGPLPCVNIAKWTNGSWDSLAGGLGVYPSAFSEVRALAILAGNIVAGGSFATPQGRLAIWNGSSWGALGSGIGSGSVDALLVRGDTLYAGGSFTSAGGTTVSNVARWDGSSWSSVGGGLGGQVRALVSYRDTIYAVADTSGANATARVYRLYAGAWHSIITLNGGSGNSLAVFKDALVVGGEFSQVGGTTYNHILSWKNGTLSQLRVGLNGYPYAMASYRCDLVVAGNFGNEGDNSNDLLGIARWDGSAWHSMASTSPKGLNGIGRALIVSGKASHVGGEFWKAGDKLSTNLASYSETATDKIDDLAVTWGKSSAALTWTTPASPDPNCGTLSYEVRSYSTYITEANYDLATIVRSGSAEEAGTPHCVLFDLLSQCAAHYYAVANVDAGGFRSLIAPISGSTRCSGFVEAFCNIEGLPYQTEESGTVLASLGRGAVELEATGLDRGVPTRIAIFNIAGRLVASSVQNASTAARLKLELRDQSDQRLRAGVYFVRLVQGGAVTRKRLILVP